MPIREIRAWKTTDATLVDTPVKDWADLAGWAGRMISTW